jgi:DNA-binding HxlR family transcriptional regulator
MNCPVARTLEVVGEWWTLLILRDAFLGLTRFEDFHQSLGIARNVLTTRLSTLVEHQIFERRPYQAHPERYEYRLTEKGLDLFPVIASLLRWGQRWTTVTQVPHLAFIHEICGHQSNPVPVCSSCGSEVTATTTRVQLVSGASTAGSPI